MPDSCFRILKRRCVMKANFHWSHHGSVAF
jgi:hypothetical protein